MEFKFGQEFRVLFPTKDMRFWRSRGVSSQASRAHCKRLGCPFQVEMWLNQEPGSGVVGHIRSSFFQAKFLLKQEPDFRVVDIVRIGVESEEIGGMGWQAQIIGTGAQERKSGSLAR